MPMMAGARPGPRIRPNLTLSENALEGSGGIRGLRVGLVARPV